MADNPAMPLWTDAYLADTRHLTRCEHGAYLLLLMEAWRRPRCRLPDDDKLLAKLACATPEEWQDIKPVVMAFWNLDERTKEWSQKRLLKEHVFVSKKRQQNRDAAARRWNKIGNLDASAYPDAMPPHPHPHPQEEKDLIIPIVPSFGDGNTEPVLQPPDGGPLAADAAALSETQPSLLPDAPSLASKPKRRAKPGASRERFEETFWPAVPKRVGKGAAWRAYQKAITTGRATADELDEGAKRWAEQSVNADPRYIPHPSTWINADRWLDDHSEDCFPGKEVNGRSFNGSPFGGKDPETGLRYVGSFTKMMLDMRDLDARRNGKRIRVGF